MTTSIAPPPTSWARIAWPVLLVWVPLATGCQTLLTPLQRQELETRVYDADYNTTFRATRNTLVNEGFVIDNSDHSGGVFHFFRDVPRYDAGTALTLSVLAPPIGDFYVGRAQWFVLDTLLWPFSIAWTAPINTFKASSTTQTLEGNASFESIANGQTRVRITVHGISWDQEEYPPVIRHLQDEIGRQVFLKEGSQVRTSPY